MAPSSEDDFHVYKLDAIDFLKTLDSESIDLFITDPAYESLEKHRKVGTTTRLKSNWVEIFPNDRFEDMFSEIYRVMKNNTHFYMMCDAETMFLAKPLAEKAGFRFWKPLIWDKVNIGMGYHYRARYEFILFFEKGKRKLNNLSVPDILTYKKIYKGYPTEKPVGLIEDLIKQSSSIGEVIVDCFGGSGSTGVAALQQNRRFLGNDSSKLSSDQMQKRLSVI